ncbi:hypothetical protein HXA35_20575 [Bacillus sp. A301a_S52]|jgi:hypothetical protein|nr:hypothetical protein [Bacillus sp. A301a_S52]
MSKYNVLESRNAQSEYQERTGSPDFPPQSGRCWNCNKNIYEPHHWRIENGRKVPATEENSTMTTGITVEKASNQLVTGCPHCNRSYCD